MFENQEGELTNSSTLDMGMKKATAIEGRLLGFVTATKISEETEMFPGSATKIAKEKIEEKIEEVLDTADDLLENKDDFIMRDNLLGSLNILLDELWEIRHTREREFAKFIVLIQSLTKRDNMGTSNDKQIEALVATLQTLKRPRIVKTDINDCRKIIAGAGLDIYKPLTTASKFKITIQEE